MDFYAHSSSDRTKQDWQLLKTHLQNVGSLAGTRSSQFNAEQWGLVAGLLHDLGKYSEAFQQRLNGSERRADHSTAGAKIVIEYLRSCQGEQWGLIAKLLAFVIAGHHAGLANGVDDGHERSTLKQRLGAAFGADIPELDQVWKTEVQLPHGLAVPQIKLQAHQKNNNAIS